jgi:hypothetical protein
MQQRLSREFHERLGSGLFQAHVIFNLVQQDLNRHLRRARSDRQRTLGEETRRNRRFRRDLGLSHDGLRSIGMRCRPKGQGRDSEAEYADTQSHQEHFHDQKSSSPPLFARRLPR